MTNVTNTETLKRNNAVEIEYETLTALVSGDKEYLATENRYGVQIVPNKNDSRTAILVKNTHTSDVAVNIAKGNSPFNAESPLVITVLASSEVVISLDSALYKDLTIDGYVLYTTDSNYAKISVACITLP